MYCEGDLVWGIFLCGPIFYLGRLGANTVACIVGREAGDHSLV